MNRRSINEADLVLKKFIEDHLGFIKANITEFCVLRNIDEVWLNGLLIFLTNQQLQKNDLAKSFINVDKERVFEIGLLDEFEELKLKHQQSLSSMFDKPDYMEYSTFLQNLVTRIMYDNQPANIKGSIYENMKSFRTYFSNFKIRMIIITAESRDRNYRVIEMTSHAANIILLVILENNIFFLILDSFQKLLAHLNNNDFEKKAQESRVITLSCGCKLETIDTFFTKCPKCNSNLYTYEIDLIKKIKLHKTESPVEMKSKYESYLNQNQARSNLKNKDENLPRRSSSAHKAETRAGYNLSFQSITNRIKENDTKDNRKKKELTYNIDNNKNNRSKSLAPGERNRNNSKINKIGPLPIEKNQSPKQLKGEITHAPWNTFVKLTEKEHYTTKDFNGTIIIDNLQHKDEVKNVSYVKNRNKPEDKGEISNNVMKFIEKELVSPRNLNSTIHKLMLKNPIELNFKSKPVPIKSINNLSTSIKPAASHNIEAKFLANQENTKNHSSKYNSLKYRSSSRQAQPSKTSGDVANPTKRPSSTSAMIWK
ncbi:unnamed protein product [Blepharisma stoltei]|uniref:Uncharacterized protein n=1 Tax=Blepharisma stoltei TaxID=1481888 RepID=A0AAU9IU22_9CILI|nr:unnamed protein product [Blepharisma stoltei]